MLILHANWTPADPATGSPGGLRLWAEDADAARRLIGAASSGADDAAGCYWDQTVTTLNGGEYDPSDPFVFTCDKNGCVE